MKMKDRIYLIFVLVFLGLLLSCSQKNSINILLDNAEGLEEGAEVISKGIKVGKVTDISFSGKELVVQLNLQKDFHITKDSKVYLVSTDIFGTKAISIELGDKNEIYSNLDTLKCVRKTGTKLDTTLMIINSAIKEVKDTLPKLLEQKNK